MKCPAAETTNSTDIQAADNTHTTCLLSPPPAVPSRSITVTLNHVTRLILGLSVSGTGNKLEDIINVIR